MRGNGDVVARPGQRVAAFHPDEKEYESEFASMKRLILCVTLVGALFATSGAGAQSTDAAAKWPLAPVRIFVGFSPGTTPDVVARIVADGLTQRLGQQFVVENRTGASGTIAANLAATATPDGLSMEIGGGAAHVTAPFLISGLPYDPLRDFASVALVGSTYNVLVVSPQLGVRNFKELLELAKAKPGSLNYASTGEGTISHIGGLMFSQLAGVPATHIPYKGSPQSNLDLAAGRIQFIFTSVTIAVPLHRAGKVRAIAVTGPKQPLLPDVPTTAEEGYPDFILKFWFAAFMPAKTPASVVARANQEINAVVKTERASKALLDQGVVPESLSPQGLDALVRSETALVKELLVKAGIKPSAQQ